jgi:hypothetical protein
MKTTPPNGRNANGGYSYAKWRLIDFSTNNNSQNYLERPSTASVAAAAAANLSKNYVLYSNSMIKNIFLRPTVVKPAAESTTTATTTTTTTTASNTNSVKPPRPARPQSGTIHSNNYFVETALRQNNTLINNNTTSSLTSNHVNSKLIDRELLMSKKDDLNTLNKYVVERIIESTKAKEAFLEAVIEKKLSDRISVFTTASNNSRSGAKSASVAKTRDINVDNFKDYYIHNSVQRMNSARSGNGELQKSPHQGGQVTSTLFQSPVNSSFTDKYSSIKINFRIDEPRSSARKIRRSSVSLIFAFILIKIIGNR